MPDAMCSCQEKGTSRAPKSSQTTTRTSPLTLWRTRMSGDSAHTGRLGPGKTQGADLQTHFRYMYLTRTRSGQVRQGWPNASRRQEGGSPLRQYGPPISRNAVNMPCISPTKACRTAPKPPTTLSGILEEKATSPSTRLWEEAHGYTWGHSNSGKGPGGMCPLTTPHRPGTASQKEAQ